MAFQTSPDWKFEQLLTVTGSEKKSVTLSGWNAPFGRPRQKGVVTDGIEIREKTVYYPGNDQPTRHIFGSRYDDWELNGRWKDSNLGNINGANQLAETVQEFVRDAVPVRISWGQILSANGLIKSFKTSRESPNEIAWTMRILIDAPNTVSLNVTQAKQVRPAKQAQLIEAKLNDGIVLPLKSKLNLNGLLGSFVDMIDSIVSSISTLTGQLIDATSAIDNFYTALIGEVERVRANIHQIRTAIITLRNTIESLETEGILVSRSADSDINWWSVNNGIYTTSITTLALLQDLENDADIAQRKRSITTYTARAGDTWENISIRFYGDPFGAQKIKGANGVRYGATPI